MDFLKQIIEQKEKEVKCLKIETLTHVKSDPNAFLDRLKAPGLSVIAEIKRHSPSVGAIAPIPSPIKLAELYAQGGAAAISVLTDPFAFKGCVDDLQQVRGALPSMPLLRKDFIIHPLQLVQTAQLGASAVLLIVAILGNQLSFFIKKCEQLNLVPLVEVHTEEELECALRANAEVIGVNHRNLKTLEVDLSVSEKLALLIPDECVSVAESGVRTLEDIQRIKNSGFSAVLVGETLVRSKDPVGFLKAVSSC
ncbi:MAG: Indole-3-glycerol phosphate synthase [Chlamydiales bacterium]|nr:Indole-3-glycerol phosphate synthase [Chlamydiales bacterium]